MFLQLLFFNFLFAFTFQTPASRPFKITPSLRIGGRIVNGDDAEDGQFPWQVAIMANSPFLGRYMCSGALIGEEWVITAGHCVDGTTSAQIYSGSTKIQSRNKTISRGVEFIHHPELTALLQNDVGLIRLAAPLEFNEFTQPIALAEDELEPDTAVIVSGWGSVNDYDTDPYADNLKFINVTTMANIDCSIYFGISVVKPGVVCTRTGYEVIRSPCLGDSGAPVVAIVDDKPVHVATFSFYNALGCEYPYPTGNTRTAYYREWIRNQTGI